MVILLLTSLDRLNRDTIRSNARFFGDNENNVPKLAVTVGIATIMDAREVMVIACGNQKAEALQGAVEGSINHMCPMSILQLHQHAIVVCDEDATSKLKASTVRYFNDNEASKYGK